MKPFSIAVMGASHEVENVWIHELQLALKSYPQMSVRSFDPGQNTEDILLVDGSKPGFEEELKKINRHEKALFLVLQDGFEIPKSLTEGQVDGVLLHPFRSLEVISKLYHAQQIILWGEVLRLNQSFTSLVGSLSEDLKLAERLQKSQLPSRFPKVKGFKLVSRYLAGLRSGGDYFDCAESKDNSQLSLLFTDASSYGLSSAVLSILMRVLLKLSAEESRSCEETVKKIYEEILTTLSPKDHLSIFYGIISRKTLMMRYLFLGTGGVFHIHPGSCFASLPAQGGAISHLFVPDQFKEQTVRMEPGDRLVLMSDGFIEGVGGLNQTLVCLDQFKNNEAKDTLNEFAFQIKSRLMDPEDMPSQDCTVLILEVDSRLVKLAPLQTDPI